MHPLHVLGATPVATAAMGGVAASFGPMVPFGRVISFDSGVLSFDNGASFGDRLWWYDVHQVEGAV